MSRIKRLNTWGNQYKNSDQLDAYPGQREGNSALFFRE
jgi:hypothetical protein